MAKMLVQPALMNFVDMITGEGDFNMTLEQYKVKEMSGVIGKTLADLNVRQKTGALILGMQHSESQRTDLNPNPHQALKEQDLLFVLGTVPQLIKFKQTYS